MKTIKIILVDDHQMIRDALRSYLEGDKQYEIIAEARSGEEAITHVRETQPDVILMDLNMSGMGGIETTQIIKKDFPEIKIIALTMLNEHQYIKQMFDAGATGYLLKNCNENEIKSAILKVKEGGMYYSPEVQESVMKSLLKSTPQPKAKFTGTFPLTQREKEVLKLIVEENSNKEIADKLFISVRTVDAHRRSLMEKTGAKNTAGLVVYAMKSGLIDDL